MWTYRHTDELYHYGILGMRWGQRRAARTTGGLSKRRRAKRDDSSPDSKKLASIRKKKVKQMSNQELRDANQRLQLESQYKDLSGKRNVGKKVVQAFIATGTTIAAIETSAKVYKKVADYAIGKLGKRG